MCDTRRASWWQSFRPIETAILAAVPKAQNENGTGRDLISHLIISNDDAPHLTRLIGFQLLTDPWIVEQPVGRLCQLLDDARCSIWGYRLYGWPGYTDETPAQPIGRPMLHAAELVVPHPKTGEPLRLTAVPPDDFVREARRLGLWQG